VTPALALLGAAVFGTRTVLDAAPGMLVRAEGPAPAVAVPTMALAVVMVGGAALPASPLPPGAGVGRRQDVSPGTTAPPDAHNMDAHCVVVSAFIVAPPAMTGPSAKLNEKDEMLFVYVTGPPRLGTVNVERGGRDDVTSGGAVAAWLTARRVSCCQNMF
jgi:hypothetical protein